MRVSTRVGNCGAEMTQLDVRLIGLPIVERDGVPIEVDTR